MLSFGDVWENTFIQPRTPNKPETLPSIAQSVSLPVSGVVIQSPVKFRPPGVLPEFEKIRQQQPWLLP